MSKHHFDGLCPRCRKKPKHPGRAYCLECYREFYAECRRKQRERVSPAFQALLREARECRESVKYLRKMGELGRVRE